MPVRLILLLILASACPHNGPSASASIGLDSKTRALLQDAIDTIDRQSTAWQQTLQKLERDLVADGQSTIANEVKNLLDHGVAAVGTQLHCTIDFIGHRMSQALTDLIDRLTGGHPAPPTPTVCQVIPSAVDLRIDPNRRNNVEYVGYDMDPNMKMLLIDNAGRETDVSRYLTFTSHYEVQLNVAQNGVPFDPARSDKLSLRWNGREISAIAVNRNNVPVVHVTTNASSPQNRAKVRATVASGQLLVGGGCLIQAPSGTLSQIITSSYPDEQGGWNCEAAGPSLRTTGAITVYAMSIDATPGLEIKLFSTTSAQSNTPSAQAQVASGYTVIGGGCRVTNTLLPPNDDFGGVFVNKTYPVTSGWNCDGLLPPGNFQVPATMTAIVIGARNLPWSVTQQSTRSASVLLDETTLTAAQGTAVYGGGCNESSPAHFLTAMVPGQNGTTWMCRAGAVNQFVPGDVTAIAIQVGR